MVIYALYNKGTSGERLVSLFADLLKHEQIEVELLDADSAQGVGLAETYDILGRPAVLLIKDDGAPVKTWQGEDAMPTPGEVAFLARQ
jgi:hypothetical protein